ncbi:MAG: hypothetical protein ABH874_06495 [Methanobacteriota archaeon]
MDEEESRKTLLNINYNKLLAYLGGDLVAFFMLFQITTEIQNLPPFLAVLIALCAFGGICVLTMASYKNYEEIIDLENKLGLSNFIEPSGFFSKRKSKDSPEREVSCYIKFAVGAFILVSFIMLLSIIWVGIS